MNCTTGAPLSSSVLGCRAVFEIASQNMQGLCRERRQLASGLALAEGLTSVGCDGEWAGQVHRQP